MGNEQSQNEKVDFLQPTIPEKKQAVSLKQPTVCNDWRVGMQHPHLLQTLGGQQEGDQYRYFFEYCQITLASLLQERYGTKKYFPEEDLQAMLLGISSALSFLQEKNISHGDVCPQEIYFDASSSSFKILDSSLINGRAFGILQATQGRFKYLSPEVYQSIGQPTSEMQLHKNDIWCLGMVMLEACVLKTNEAIYSMGIQPFVIQERINEIAQIYNPNLAENIALMLTFQADERPDPVTLFNYLLEQQRLAQEQPIPPQQYQQTAYGSQQQPQPQLQPQYAQLQQQQLQQQLLYQQSQVTQQKQMQIPAQQQPYVQPPQQFDTQQYQQRQPLPQQENIQQQQLLQQQQQQQQQQQLYYQQQQQLLYQQQQQQLYQQQQYQQQQLQNVPPQQPQYQQSNVQNYNNTQYTSYQQEQTYNQGLSREKYGPTRQVVKKVVYPDGRVEYPQDASRINNRVLGNIENQAERPMTNVNNEQNIYRLKQEIEQSKTLLNQYQNPKVQPNTNNAESIEERIRKVIAQSQALRENFA